MAQEQLRNQEHRVVITESYFKFVLAIIAMTHM